MQLIINGDESPAQLAAAEVFIRTLRGAGPEPAGPQIPLPLAPTPPASTEPTETGRRGRAPKAAKTEPEAPSPEPKAQPAPPAASVEPASTVTETVTATAAAGPKLTKNDMVKALETLMGQANVTVCMEVLARYNAKSAGQLAESDYPAFLKACAEVAPDRAKFIEASGLQVPA